MTDFAIVPSENSRPRPVAIALYIPVVLTVSIFLPYYFTVAAVMLTSGAVLVNRGMRERVFKYPGARRLIAALFVPFYVAAFHENLNGMMYAVLMLAAAVCAMYLKSVMTKALFRPLLDIACACSVACAGIAVAQKISMWPSQPFFRPMSMFMNANYYGAMSVFMILVALHRFLNSPMERWPYVVTLFCNLVGLYLCASMSSMATMVIAVFALLLLERRKKLVVIMALLVCAAGILVLLVPEIYPRLDNVDVTFGSRLSIWKTALKGILETPLLGRGAEAYPLVCAEFGGYYTYHCHNLLLDSLLNFGLIGTGAAGIFGLFKAHQLYVRYKNRVCTEYTALTAAVALAVLVHGFTDVTVFWIQTGMFFLLLFSSTGIQPSPQENQMYRTVTGMLKPSSVPEGRLRTEYMK